jgi:hypothetical protein
MTSARNAVKLSGQVKQNNLPPECGQPIDAGDYRLLCFLRLLSHLGKVIEYNRIHRNLRTVC